MPEEKPKYLWKSMQADMKSAHGNINWKIGEWQKEDKAVKCEKGFHASERVIDAMGFVPLEILALVEVRGKCDKEKDKQCWTEMRIIEAYKWEKKNSVALSIFAAELCLKNFEKVFPDDKRPREAIEAAKKWLAEPTKANESAAVVAESAAWSAASLAWSAWSASLAWSAWSAWSAAESAARSAGSAAGSAVWSAAWSAGILEKCEKFIQKEIKTLEAYK